MKSEILLRLALVVGVVLPGCSSRQRHPPSKVEETCSPRGCLVLSGHTLYGTTSANGGGFWDWGCGTVFKIDTDGSGFAILHRFAPVQYPDPTNRDGAFPLAGLVLSGDELYGTTSTGGSAGGGTVFEIKTNGGNFAVLHSFQGRDGARPMAGLMLSGHTLYGTTQRGGVNEGVIFAVGTDGAGFATLHTFTALGGTDYTNCDGAFPQTELVLSGRTLYGTAWCGGDAGHGTVFKVDTKGAGFAVLHNFAKTIDRSREAGGHTVNSDGAYLESGLVLSGHTLFGTASEGGVNGRGTIFEVGTDGTGFAVLHTFTQIGLASPQITNSDGGHPGNLVLAGNTLFATTSEGGASGRGTFCAVRTNGAGFATLPILSNSELTGPLAGLLRSGDAFYGTTEFGGKGAGGIVFKLGTNGTGFALLHGFTEKPLPPGLSD
jgi:uncharacterized repeat protein (TIGR03803 family)